MSKSTNRIARQIAAALLARIATRNKPLTVVDLDTLEMEAFRLTNGQLLTLWHQDAIPPQPPPLHSAVADLTGLSPAEAAASLTEDVRVRCNAAAEAAESFDRPETVCLALRDREITYAALQEALLRVHGSHLTQAVRLLQADGGCVFLCGSMSDWLPVTYQFRRLYAGKNPFFDPTLPDDIFLFPASTAQLAAEGQALLQEGTIRVTSVCTDRIVLRLHALTDNALVTTEHVLASPGQDEAALRNVSPAVCYACAGSSLTLLVNDRVQEVALPEGFLSDRGELITIRVQPDDPALLSLSVSPDRTTAIPITKE